MSGLPVLTASVDHPCAAAEAAMRTHRILATGQSLLRSMAFALGRALVHNWRFFMSFWAICSVACCRDVAFHKSGILDSHIRYWLRVRPLWHSRAVHRAHTALLHRSPPAWPQEALSSHLS